MEKTEIDEQKLNEAVGGVAGWSAVKAATLLTKGGKSASTAGSTKKGHNFKQGSAEAVFGIGGSVAASKFIPPS